MTLKHEGLPGRFEAIRTSGPVYMPDLGRAAFPIDLLIVDAPHFVTTRREMKTERARLREIYVEAKRLALGIDGERPIGVVLTHQLSRTGVSAAGEIYESALDEKILKTVDVVTTCWHDAALAHYDRALFSMVKNRDGRLAEPFGVSIDPKTRRMSWVDLDAEERETAAASGTTVGLNEKGEVSVYDEGSPETAEALERLCASFGSKAV